MTDQYQAGPASLFVTAARASSIEFDTEFDPDALFFTYRRDDEGLFYLAFYEDGQIAHVSNKKFDDVEDADNYAKDVISRYRRMICAAELAFITQEENPNLDPDYRNVIRSADQAESEGVG